MMEEVKMFRISNGELFDTKKEARKAENLLTLKDLYRNNYELHGDEGYINFNYLVNWLKENKEFILEIYKTEEE